MACKYIFNGVEYKDKQTFVEEFVKPNFINQPKTLRVQELQQPDFLKLVRKDKDYLKSQGLTDQEVSFLNLLFGKDEKWTSFFIKSLIQNAAKNGYSKVWLPTGNTASKIEGHTTSEEFKKQKEDRIKELEKQRTKELEIINLKYEAFKEAEKNKELFPSSKVFYTEDKYERLATLRNEYSNFDKKNITLETDLEINQLKQELERVETEGFGALKPIYNFYENTVTNILNKTYGKENVKVITDEYGNKWNEVKITPEYRKQLILLQTPAVSPQEILNKTIKGFELSPVKDAFANAFLSKNNKSSPELANRINEWIGKNGWSGVNFRYDSTYKTINYILQENAKKDLNIRKKYFKEGNVVESRDVLMRMANSKHSLAPLATKLLSYSDTFNVPINLVEGERIPEEIMPDIIAAGAYFRDNKNIYIAENANFKGDGVEPTILHEILHAYTARFLDENPFHPIVDDLYQILNYVRDNNKGITDKYYLKTKDEFLVGFFTSSQFIQDLQKMPAINKFNSYKNLWEEILDYIMNLFRMNSKEKNLYQELFPLMTNIIEEAKQFELKNPEVETTIEDYYRTHDSLVDQYSVFEEPLSYNSLDDLNFYAEEINNKQEEVFTAPFLNKTNSSVTLTGYSRNLLPDNYRRNVEGKYYKNESNKIILNRVSKRLQKLFPEINIQYVNQYELLQEEHLIPIHEIKSFIKNNTVYLVEGAYNESDKIEELLHPFILGLSYKNEILFDKIYQDALLNYQKENEYYSQISPETAKLEVVVKALRDELSKETHSSWFDEIIKFIKQALQAIFPRTKLSSKIPTSYSIKELGELLMSGGFKFETAISSNPQYSASPGEGRITEWRDKLKNFAKDANLVKDLSPDEKGNQKGYYHEGNRLMRVSKIIENINKKRFEGFPLSEQQKILSNIAREEGTDFHAIQEDIIRRWTDPETNILLTTANTPNINLNGRSQEIYDLLEQSLLERMQNYEPGTIFLTETVLANLKKSVILTEDEKTLGYSKKGLASTLDFIAITPEGKFHVLDWKFVSPSEKTLPKGKKEDYDLQLNEYVETIRVLTGARREDFEKVQIIPYVVGRDLQNNITSLLTPSLDMSKISNKRQIPYISTAQNIPHEQLKDMIAALNKLPLIESIRNRQLEEKGDFKEYELRDIIDAAVTDVLLADKNFDGNFNALLEIHKKAYEDAQEVMEFLSKASDEPIDDSNFKKISEQLQNTFELISAIKSLRVAAQFVYGKNYENKINNSPEEEQLKNDIRKFNENIETLEDDFTTLEKKIQNSFGEYKNVYGLSTVTERKVRGFEKLFTFLTSPETRAADIFSKVFSAMRSKLDQIINSNYILIDSMRSNTQKEASKKGKSLKETIDILIDKGEGKNPQLKSKISKTFWDERNAILASNDVAQIKEFYSKWYDMERFEKWANEQFEKKAEEKRLTKGTDAWKQKEIEKISLRYDLSNPGMYLSFKKSLDSNYLLENKEFQDKYYTEFGKYITSPENISIAEFYNHIIETNRKLWPNGLAPEGFNPYTFIPNMDKGLIERFREGDVSLTSLKRTLLDNIRVTPNSGLYGNVDPATNLEVKEVFVPFVYDHFQGDYSRKSLDLFTVYGIFEEHLEEAIAKKQISPFTESLIRVEKSKKVLPISSFGQIKKFFGKSGPETIQAVEDKANAKYLEQFTDALIYGKTIQDSLDHKWQDGKGNTYSVAKVIQEGMGLMYKTTFGLNLFTPLRQYFEGIVSAGFLKGEDFRGRELLSYPSFFKSITSPAKLDSKTQTFAALVGYFLPFTNQQFNKKADKLSVNKLTSWISPENLTFLMEESDRRNQLHIIYALLQNTVIVDGELKNSKRYINALPEYANYYEDILTDGKIDNIKKNKLDKEIESRIEQLNKEKGILTNTSLKDGKIEIAGLSKEKEDDSINWFKNLTQFYSSKTTGMTGRNDYIGYKGALMGRLMGMYRTWIIPTTKARLGSVKYNTNGDKYEWGRWISFGSAVAQTWKESWYKTAFTILGFGKKDALIKYAKEKYLSTFNSLDANNKIFTKEFLSEKEFVDKYLNDVNNTVNEFRFITAVFFALSFGILTPGDDDDEELKNLKLFAQFQMQRSLSGFTFYMNPNSFTDIVNNAIPAVSYINNVFKLVAKELPKEIIGQTFGPEEWADQAHPLKYFSKSVPLMSEILKYIPIISPDAAKDLGIQPVSYQSFY